MNTASLVLTSNLAFSGWGGVFGDQAVAAAMLDRVVHHADVLTVKGAGYRPRNRGIDTLPSIRTQNTADWKHEPVASFSSVGSASSSSVADTLVVRRRSPRTGERQARRRQPA